MLITVIRTCLLYILIIFAVRLMGKRQISEMQTSELVITLLMSNIATIPMQDTEQSMLSGVIPIMVLLVCEIFLSYLMLKKSHIRKLICGKPVVVINKGKIDQKAMKELRMSTEDLTEQLRQKDVFDINEVAFAVIETNGMLSVMKKSSCDMPTVRELKISRQPAELKVSVISDGEISLSSLSVCGWNQQKITETLQKEQISIKDVFLMVADSTGSYTIIQKEKSH